MYAFGPFSDFYNHSLYYIGDLSRGQWVQRFNIYCTYHWISLQIHCECQSQRWDCRCSSYHWLSRVFICEVWAAPAVIDDLLIRGYCINSSDKNTGLLDPMVPLSFSLSEDAVGVTLMLDILIDVNISASMTTGTGSSAVSSTIPSPSQSFLSSGATRQGFKYVWIASTGIILGTLSLGM